MQPADSDARSPDRPLACVTGASAGIGAAFARALAERGFDLLLVARRRERLEALARELPGAAAVLVADLARPDGQAQVAARLAAAPRLRLLVNNAGGLTRGPFHRAPIADEVALAQVHVLAPLQLTHAALGGMVARGQGAVIQVASRAAFAPNAELPTYAAAKAFLHRHAVALAAELDGTGVRFVSVCPGNVRTELFERAGYAPEEIARMAALEPEVVVAAALESLDRGEVVCVPGERRSVRLLRALLPRALAAKLAGVLGRVAGG